MMTTNLSVIANVKHLRTGGSFRILLPFFPLISWSVGVLNSAVFNSFHNRVEFGTILVGLRNYGGRGFLNPPPQTNPLGTPLVTLNKVWNRECKFLPHFLASSEDPSRPVGQFTFLLLGRADWKKQFHSPSCCVASNWSEWSSHTKTLRTWRHTVVSPQFTTHSIQQT